MKLTKSLFGHFWPIFIFGMTFHSEAQIKESFDDENFKSNPTWAGDTSKFKVISGTLQSQSTVVNDQFYLSTKSNFASNTQWEFYINLTFNTSSANYVDVFLASDSANLLGKNSGYFIRLGSTNDNISLYKKSGNVITSLILGKFGITNSSNSRFKIKVIHNKMGYFNLWRDSTGSGEHYLADGLAHDTTFNTSKYFGLTIRQSSASFHKRHFFDNIYCGPIITDTLAPLVKLVSALSPDTLLLFFSEPLNKASLWLENFELNQSIGFPIHSRFPTLDSSMIELKFSKAMLANIFYELKIKNCRDTADNFINDTFLNIKWEYYQKPELHDIVINECMIDPEPAKSLPNHEFIELYNRSSKFIDLANCHLEDKTSGIKLPKIILAPDSFLILCDTDYQTEFQKYGKTKGLNNFPVLNNTGDEITLRNAQGQTVHRIKYNLNSYGDVFKQNGGWSLEMIDPNTPCLPQNFRASINSKGATPGKANSIKGVNQDTIKPHIEAFFLRSDSSISILFDEPLDSISAVISSNYRINDNQIKRIICNYELLEITFTLPLSHNKLYTIELKGLTDCSQNTLMDTSLNMALPQAVLEGDILINEVMFDPKTGGDDFIELINNSSKILSLRNLMFFNFDENKLPVDICVIDTNGLLFLPNQIFTFTVNPSFIIGHYLKVRPENIIKTTSLPALSNEEGHFGIANHNGAIIDQMSYSDYMHLQLLTNVEGVSLERIRADLPSMERSNWTSAAASYGYATPGLVNSHHMTKGGDTKDWLTIAPSLFSPDEDGMDDLASFTITTDRVDQQATLIIFEVSGKLLKIISNNMPIGNTQTWFWDGTYDGIKKAPIGIYIVYAELFGLNGKRQVLKKTITLGGK